MIRKIVIISLIATLCIGFSLLVGGNACAKPIKWILATNVGSSTCTWAFGPYPRFQKMVEEATGGRLIMDTKMGLFPPTQTIHGVIQGRADIGFQRIPWAGGTFAAWDIGSLPFFFDNFYEYESTINDPRYIKIMEKSYGDLGLIRLCDPTSPCPDSIFGKKPLATVDDFKGLKIRTTGLLPTFACRRMGAHPVSVGTTEIAQALARGMVDAVQTGAAFGLGLGIADVTTHASFWRVQSVFPGCLAVNKKSWDALPDDIKKILVKVGRDLQSQTFLSSYVEYLVSKKATEVVGIKVTNPEKREIDKARALCAPAINEWLKAAGPYGKEILAVAADYASGAEIMLRK